MLCLFCLCFAKFWLRERERKRPGTATNNKRCPEGTGARLRTTSPVAVLTSAWTVNLMSFVLTNGFSYSPTTSIVPTSLCRRAGRRCALHQTQPSVPCSGTEKAIDALRGMTKDAAEQTSKLYAPRNIADKNSGLAPEALVSPSRCCRRLPCRCRRPGKPLENGAPGP